MLNIYNFFVYTTEVNGYQQFFGYDHCSKLRSTEEWNSYSFVTSWGCFNFGELYI